MRFGWSNSLLLAFLAVEAVTGFFSLTAGGRPDNAAFIIIHRVAGYGILFILAWKLRLVFSSLKYPRSKTPRYASIFLMVVLLATLGTGFAWSLAGPYSFSLFSGVSWHINLGVLLVPVFIWHAIYQTRGFPLSFWADRRSFLRLSAAAVAGLAAWQLSELGTRVSRASDSESRFTGSYEAKSFSGNDFPRTSWLNDSPRPVGLDGWALEISGETGRTLSLSYDDLDGSAETIATLDCTGGWYSTQVWTGTPVADLLERAELLDSAASVTFNLCHRLLQALLARRGPALSAGDQGRRREAVAQPRLPGTAGSARQARLRMGQVGRPHRGQRHIQVAPATPACPVGGGGLGAETDAALLVTPAILLEST